MNVFYPAAEPECDGCPHQFQLDENLCCDWYYGVTAIYHYPKCMRERKE